MVKCAFKKMLPIGELKVNPRNRNKHPETQIKQLAKIIEFQGWRHPIIISNLTGFIVAGHGRFESAKLLGLAEVPVDYQDFTDADQEYLFVQSDNAIALQAELDLSGINADLDGLGPFDIELLGIKNFNVDPSEIENTCEELNEADFQEFQHECPKCGFEWNNAT